MNRDGSNSRLLTASLDRSVGTPRWASDNRSIYVDYVDHGVTKIARVPLEGRLETVEKELAELKRGEGACGFGGGPKHPS